MRTGSVLVTVWWRLREGTGPSNESEGGDGGGRCVSTQSRLMCEVG